MPCRKRFWIVAHRDTRGGASLRRIAFFHLVVTTGTLGLLFSAATVSRLIAERMPSRFDGFTKRRGSTDTSSWCNATCTRSPFGMKLASQPGPRRKNESTKMRAS